MENETVEGYLTEALKYIDKDMHQDYSHACFTYAQFADAQYRSLVQRTRSKEYQGQSTALSFAT